MNLKHVLIVFKKELMDMFRDRKTIISSILIPILIFPLMYGFMNSSQKKIVDDVEKKGVDISIKADSNDISIVKYLKDVKELNIIEVDNAEDAVKKGEVKAVVFVDTTFDKDINSGKTAPLTILYDDSNQSSIMAMQMLQGHISAYSSLVVTQRLIAKNIDPSIINPISIINKSSSQEEGNGIGVMIFSMLLPLMLAIYSATSVLPAATDNGAGEKERGTLEPLLTTQANRLSLLGGKYLAITVAGILGTISSLIGLFIAQKISPEILGNGKMLSPSIILIIALITFCLTLIFAALELAISIYARSFKEAQTYLSPITIIAMIPAFAVYMIDPKNIAFVYFNIPIVNLICVMKELIVGIVNPIHIIVAFLWAIVYISISIIFARYMFNREGVIFRV